MDTIRLPDGVGTRYIGFRISCKDNTGMGNSRMKCLKMAQTFGQLGLPFTVEMPCGETITCETLEDIPTLADVPCPCGAPNHWLVKWEQD